MKNRHQVHNLIILDESGSMSSIKPQIISGFNELVQSIKGIEEQFPEQEHFISLVSFNDIENKIYEMAEIIREHEFKIIESIFSRGEIPTIKKEDLENFILSRIDVCMVRMGLKAIHNVKNCKVSNWFDKILGNTQNNDFFAGQGASYSRGFKQDEFKWVKK